MKNFLVVVAVLAVAVTIGVSLISNDPEASKDVGVVATLNGMTDEQIKAIKAKAESIDAIQRPVASETGPWPKAVADVVDYNFGRMQVKTQQEHVFTISNEGEADLNLVAGQPTCKCTAFTLSKTRVPPGESAELLIRWEGKFNDERFSHGGDVYTDDPEKPEIRFVVQGAVDNPVSIIPEGTWDVGSVTDTKVGEFNAAISSRVFEEFAITEIKSESPFIETSVEAMTEDMLLELDALSGYNIKVKVLPGMPPGTLQEKLEIFMDCLESGPVIIDLIARKDGPITILNSTDAIWVPSTSGLKLGQFSRAKGREATMTIMVEKNGMTEPMVITEVVASPAYLTAKLEPDGSASSEIDRYKLTVSVPPGVAPRTSVDSTNPAKMDIKFNHPSGQSLNFKLSFGTF